MNKAEEACIGIYEAFTQIESQRLGVETKIAWNVGMNLKENRADFVDVNLQEENDKLIAENKRLKFENKEQQDYFQTLPVLECSSLSDEEVWIRGWCAVTKSDSCISKDTSISWADCCLDEFKKRFKNG